MKDISRRDFLKYLGAGTVGLITKPKIPLTSKKERRQTSDVIQCFDETATSGSSVNLSTVQIMIDESIKVLTGINDVGEAWKSIFPGIVETSIIGIKVNCINSAVPTRPEVVDCIINGLAQMIVNSNNYQKNNVVIWDRTNWELTNSGYTFYIGSDPDTPRCFGTNQSGVGYDSTCPLYINGGTRYPSRILSQMCDYLINVGVLKNHGTSQVTLTMKNHYGSVNTVGSELHSSYCNPGIPCLNQRIRDVITPNNIQRLFIIDTLWASVVSGPGGSPSWNPKKIIVSEDPVACDYHGWNVINEERTGSGYSAIPWPIYHIQAAEQSPYNLGTTNINLIEINNPSGIKESKVIQQGNGVFRIAPNPFHKGTTIMISLNRSSNVYLDLLETSGRVITNIHQGQLSKGMHRINFSIKNDIGAGTYFVRLYNQGEMSVKKVTILR